MSVPALSVIVLSITTKTANATSGSVQLSWGAGNYRKELKMAITLKREGYEKEKV